MSNTFVERAACCRLTLRPHRESFIEALPRADRIRDGLEKQGICIGPSIRISDMLPHDCVYKPLTLDLITIRSDDEYRSLKRIKSARYVHTGLRIGSRSADALLFGIQTGAIVFCGPIMAETGVLREPPRKELHPEFERPIVYRITERDRFDVYISADEATRRGLDGLNRIEIDGTVFDAETLRFEQPYRGGQAFVLQADLKISERLSIAKDSESVFRIRSAQDGAAGYLRAGSVIDGRDCFDVPDGTEISPYIIGLEAYQ